MEFLIKIVRYLYRIVQMHERNKDDKYRIWTKHYRWGTICFTTGNIIS